MNQTPIYTDQNELNSQLGIYRKAASSFQIYVDKFNSIEGFENLQSNELSSFFQNPKGFIINRLTSGQGLPEQFGFSPEKVFELMEKPNGTDELIQELDNFISSRHSFEALRYLHALELDENSNVVLSNHIQNTIENSCSIVLNTESKQAAYDLLLEVVQKLKDLKAVKHFDEKTIFENVIHFEKGAITPNLKFLFGIK